MFIATIFGDVSIDMLILSISYYTLKDINYAFLNIVDGQIIEVC